jgi:PadR family transcriptional regulator, regulatory protein PadR
MTAQRRTEPVFLILTALIDQPRHGYGITQEVRHITDGDVDLRVGTLYGALDRLAAEGLIEADRDEIESGRLRRYYRLTNAGAAVLAAEARRMAAEASVATERLKGFTGVKGRAASAGNPGPGLAGGAA